MQWIGNKHVPAHAPSSTESRSPNGCDRFCSHRIGCRCTAGDPRATSLLPRLTPCCHIPESFKRPPRNSELALFRVLQESLTNVHRRSEASAARVTLVPEGEQLRLEVADNGSGISEEWVKQLNESAKDAGVGIAGMRELGGSFDIESNPKGTAIRVLCR